jgi:hypothetical protein
MDKPIPSVREVFQRHQERVAQERAKQTTEAQAAAPAPVQPAPAEQKPPLPTVESTPPPPSGPAALEMLTRHNAEIIARFEEVRAQFDAKGKVIDPTKHAQFREILQIYLTLSNMTYIQKGTFELPNLADIDPIAEREEQLAQAGVAVSTADRDAAIAGGIDPAIANSPAGQLALRLGADITGDHDDAIDDSGLQPERKEFTGIPRELKKS